MISPSAPTVRVALGLAALTGLLGTPAAAQSLPIDPSVTRNATNQNEGMGEIGRTTQTGVGEVGQRQSLDDVAPNIAPLQRIETRINTRLQNRLRNRIDRDYNADATSSYEDARNQIYDAGRRARSR